MAEEVRNQVVPMRVQLRCECGQFMSPTGITLMSYPPQYEHECPGCKIKMNMRRSYPYVEFNDARGT